MALPENILYFGIRALGEGREKAELTGLEYHKGLFGQQLTTTRTRTFRWEGSGWQDVNKFSSKPLTEKQTLERFLGILEKQKSGTVLAGWNIGYEAELSKYVGTTERGGAPGFDIPTILRRAERYGMKDRYEAALKKMTIKDIGQEYALKIAEQATKYPHLLTEQVQGQLEGYVKLSNFYKQHAGVFGGKVSQEETAQFLSQQGYRVAGWRRDLVYRTVVPTGKATSALEQLIELSQHQGPIFRDEGAVKAWGTEVRENMLAASNEAIKKKGLDTTRRISAGKKYFNFASIGRDAVKFVASHKKLVGSALAVAGLWAIGAGSWFSGKDDRYNTIEGLEHGGEASRLRKAITEFGSGWVRKAIERGLSPEKIAEALTKIGTGKGFAQAITSIESKGAIRRGVSDRLGTGLTGLSRRDFVSEAVKRAGQGEEKEVTKLVKFIRSAQKVKGDEESFVVSQLYGRGGFGQTYQAYGLKSGRSAIYKEYHKHIAEMTKQTIDADQLVAGPAFLKAWGTPAEAPRRMQKYAAEYMSKIRAASDRISEGKLSLVYEAAMQRAARQKYGELVPAVLGETKKGFIQEFGGVSIPYTQELIKKHPDTGKSAIDILGKVWNRLITGGAGPKHFDPSLQNIVRQGTKLRAIDWGVAIPEGSLSAPSRRAARSTIKKYIGSVEREIVEPKFIKPAVVTAPARPAQNRAIEAARHQQEKVTNKHLIREALETPTGSTSTGRRGGHVNFEEVQEQLEARVKEGFSSRGISAVLRKKNTDFGSPVDLLKAAKRASKLYKKHIVRSLKNKKIDSRSIQWTHMIESDDAGVAMHLIAKNKEGQLLAGMSRMFGKKGVDLTQIEVGTNLPAGLGKSLYLGEADILRKVGYTAGDAITSPISSPITARWQMKMYGSKIAEASGVDPSDFRTLEQAIVNKEVSKESFRGMSLQGTLPSRPSIFERLGRKRLYRTSDAFDERTLVADRRTRMQDAHKKAMVDSSTNSLRPGKRHRNRSKMVV